MKIPATLFLLLAVLYGNSQSFNSPESVEYDAIHQRYIVSNTSANNLQQLIPGSTPTLFASSVPGPYGIAIVGDTVYVCCNGTHLRGYNLTTGAMAFDANLGGTFLNGICTDFAGNIYVTDFTAKKIVRYNIASQQFNYFVGTAMTKQPNGIVYDPFHNRLVVATWGTNAPVLGVSLSDSTVSTLLPTTLSNIDGMTIDEDGNFYAADWGSDGVYFFDSAFANAPIKAVSGLGNPADISYTQLSDTVAVPNTQTSTVQFFGFPRPHAVDDTAAVSVGNQQSICVLQNDYISGNVPLVLQGVSNSALGSASIAGNCINYTANSAGNDTLTYTVCSVDTPSFCKTAMLYITANSCVLPSFTLSAYCNDGTPITQFAGCPWCANIIATGFGQGPIQWHVRDEQLILVDTTVTADDTLSISLPQGCMDAELQLPYNFDWIVCATATNSCGSTTVCDTIRTYWEGIAETALANVSLFPNPASNLLTIDLSRVNANEISSYSSVEIINSLGQVVAKVHRNSQITTLNLSGLANGFYLAAIVPADGKRKAVGNFTIDK